MASGLGHIAPVGTVRVGRADDRAARLTAGLVRLAPLWIAFVVVVVFARVAWHDLLLWDDNVNITRNPHLNPRVTAAGVATLWSEPYAGLYVPATYTWIAAEKWLAERVPPARSGRPATWVFHAGNVALHLGCALVVFSILRRTMAGAFPEAHRSTVGGAALVGALFFAVHPLQVEAVAWATEAKTLLAALLALASLRLYLVGCDGTPSLVPVGGAARAAYVGALLLFALAILSKPTVVVLPVLALLAAWLVERRCSLWHVYRLAPWVALGVLLAWRNKSLQPDTVLAYAPRLIERIWIAGDAVAFYAGKLVAPVGLAIDYGRSPRAVLAGAWWPAAIAAVVLLAAVMLLRRRPVGLAAVALSLVALAPVVGLVPFEFQNISTVADRYAYLALVGPAMGLAAWICWGRWAVLGWMSVAVFIPALAVLSYRQAEHWRTDETLYERALTVNPASHVAHGNLGALLMAKGDPAAAEAHYREATRVAFNASTHAGDLTNLATALVNQRRYDEAQIVLDEALLYRPQRPQTLSTLANLHIAQGRYDRAREYCLRAIERRSDRAIFWIQLGSIEMHRNELDAATAAFARAVELDPRSADALRGMAQVAQRQEQYQRALDLYTRAIQASPDDWQPHYDVGRLLYSLRQWDKAAHSFHEAAVRNPTSAMVHNNLATALVKLRRLDEALTHFRRAVELDPQLTDARDNLRKLERHMAR